MIRVELKEVEDNDKEEVLDGKGHNEAHTAAREYSLSVISCEGVCLHGTNIEGGVWGWSLCGDELADGEAVGETI